MRRIFLYLLILSALAIWLTGCSLDPSFVKFQTAHNGFERNQKYLDAHGSTALDSAWLTHYDSCAYFLATEDAIQKTWK